MSDRPSKSGSRREFLSSGVSWTGALALGGACAETRDARAAPPVPGWPEGDPLDAALERLHAHLPDADIHRSNHVPMVVETLCVLGRGDAIAPWFEANVDAEHVAPPGPRRPIALEGWRDALGDEQRFADWQALFLAELEREEWKLVVRRWCARLAPGLAGAATHGVIRTAHATRGLAARDSAIRRRELATGLAYWAASYEELPWDGTLAPEPSVAAALARVEPRRPALEPPAGNIVTGLRALAGTPSFVPVAGLVDTSDPARTLGELTSVSARLYLANPERRVAFTHGVTAPSALRLLAPYLDDESVERALRFAWQAAAGLYVVYGDPRSSPQSSPAHAHASVERAALVARAVENGAAHAIKLTEACLREEAFTHDPLLLDAARDAGESMHG